MDLLLQAQDLAGLVSAGHLAAKQLGQFHDLGHQLAVGLGLAAPLQVDRSEENTS